MKNEQLLDSTKVLLPQSGSAPRNETAPLVGHHQWRLSLDHLGVTPGWYRLRVSLAGKNGLVGARLRFSGGRLPELRMRLEKADDRHFTKTLKVSQPVDCLTIMAEGAAAVGIECVELRPLGQSAVVAFIIKKGARYLFAMRHRPDLRLALRKLKAAIRPSASFAFQADYTQPDDDTAYAAWRAIHEDPESTARVGETLGAIANGNKIRVILLIADGFDPKTALEDAKATLTGSAIDLAVSTVSEFSLDNTPCFVLPIDHPGIFRIGAIEQMALRLSNDPELVAVYADSDLLAGDGERKGPRLKPVWDKELLWSTDYIRAPLLVRWQSDLENALSLPGAHRKPSYAIAVTVIAQYDRKRLAHIPEILFHETPQSAPGPEIDFRILEGHLRKATKVPPVSLRDDGILRVDWPALPSTSVSIIIPSKDNPGLLKACVDSIISKTVGIIPEIVIADNGSVRADTKTYLDKIASGGIAKVIPCPGPFNFSKINNDARRHATGDVIVLLNDDTQIISPDWLSELAGLALRPEVGAVGGLLLYPDGTIQHAGVLLGVGGATADHAFRYLPGDSKGYIDLLRCRREVCAVTGACLAVSAEHFDLIGGLDETLLVTLNDIDFCLRLRDRGLTNIWTPWAVLEHWESKSRGIDYTESALARQANEVRIFSERWGELLARDPTYHPGLNDNAPDYHLAI